MATLRADENRYLLQAAPEERPAVSRIPGARLLPGGRNWQLPRQSAVLLALDRVLSRHGWTPEIELEQEVAEARGRHYPPPEAVARVQLEGGVVSVECTIADKELVKQVPGYRWSPAHKRWYLAAMPLALDILRDAFGDRLEIDREAEEFIELKRLDEKRGAEAQQARQSPVTAESSPSTAAPVAPATQEDQPASETFRELRLVPSDGVLTRLEGLLERLVVATEALAARLEGLGSVPEALSIVAAPEEPSAGDQPEVDTTGWREILTRATTSPGDALNDARRRLQTSREADTELRAVAGIAAWRANEADEAFLHLKKALEPGMNLEDADLTTMARKTYEDVVVSLINLRCGPEQALSGAESLREALRRELCADEGFKDDEIGSPEAREILDLLVTDRALRLTSAELSDYIRIAHLLSTARGGTRMATERIADVLRDSTLSADAFALGDILFANILRDVKCASMRMRRWPGADSDAPLDDARWLVEAAVRRLSAAEPSLAGEAALAVLDCIASGPPEQGDLSQRRTLVSYTVAGTGQREYAEFLAMYRLAAAGERLPLDSFRGYVTLLATVPLDQSASYITEVYFTGEDVPGSAVRPIADEVYLPALAAYGVTDHDEQLLALLDLVAAGSRPDNLLNRLGEMVEAGSFPGSEMLDRDGRIAVYRRALDASVKMGHDEDAVEAFDRLVREYANDGDSSRLRELCAEFESKFKPLRLPALLAALESALEEGADPEKLVEAVRSGMKARTADARAAAVALEGLSFAYPQLKDVLPVANPGQPAEDDKPSFRDARLLIVGGREDQRKRAVPVLESWGVEATWLNPEQAKNGAQATALAEGRCNLVVVNTRCIGHAASGRVKEAAESVANEVWMNHANGLGTFLFELKRKLSAEAATEGHKASPKLQQLKKIAKR